MTITDSVIQRIILHLFRGEDYRIEVVSLINAAFLDFAIAFFKKVVEAKLKSQEVTADWYRTEFLNDSLPSAELIIYSGLNEKTVRNMYKSTRREIVLEAISGSYERLYEAINELVEQGNEIDLTLTIKLRGVSVDLNISESLIVINTLAVKRAQLRGGLWSTAGKRVEKMLMLTLCRFYEVSEDSFYYTGMTDERREIDFYLVSPDGVRHNCEVKLMGKGNPESADAIIARASEVFIADTLSDLNKEQLTGRGVKWVELYSPNGYEKFSRVLRELNIPYTEFNGDVNSRLQEIFQEIF